MFVVGGCSGCAVRCVRIAHSQMSYGGVTWEEASQARPESAPRNRRACPGPPAGCGPPLPHRLRVARALARAEALQGELQVIFMLLTDARHLRPTAHVGAMADHAAVLLRQRLAARHARRIGRRRGRRGGHSGQGGDEVREAAQVLVLHGLRDRGHRRVVAPAFAKEKQLRDRIERMLAPRAPAFPPCRCGRSRRGTRRTGPRNAGHSCLARFVGHRRTMPSP